MVKEQRAGRWLRNGGRAEPVRAQQGGGGSKEIVFYTSEAVNLLKTKDSTFQKRAKRTQNEPPKAPKKTLSCAIDGGFCDFRGVGLWGLQEV
jgi:hypothetical protein